MTELRDFKVGDRVESPFGAQGRVSKVGDAVRVTFKEKGKTWEGIYDENWFRIYGPKMLKNFDASARADQ